MIHSLWSGGYMGASSATVDYLITYALNILNNKYICSIVGCVNSFWTNCDTKERKPKNCREACRLQEMQLYNFTCNHFDID